MTATLPVDLTHPFDVIMDLLRPPQGRRPDEIHWRFSGACRNADPALFAPTEDGENYRRYPRRARRAVRYCARCPVVDACTEQAERLGEQGVWGGQWFMVSPADGHHGRPVTPFDPAERYAASAESR